MRQRTKTDQEFFGLNLVPAITFSTPPYALLYQMGGWGGGFEVGFFFVHGAACFSLCAGFNAYLNARRQWAKNLSSFDYVLIAGSLWDEQNSKFVAEQKKKKNWTVGSGNWLKESTFWIIVMRSMICPWGATPFTITFSIWKFASNSFFFIAGQIVMMVSVMTVKRPCATKFLQGLKHSRLQLKTWLWRSQMWPPPSTLPPPANSQHARPSEM